jgi:hypothetical protein
MAQSMLAGAQQVALQTIADEGERADAQEQMDRLFIRLQPALRQAMPDFLEKYAQVYATEFSADELRQLITFAESPAGRHYTAQAVSLQNDPLLQEAQAELWDKLSPVMDDFNKERCAKRAAQRIAAGDAKAKCPLAAKSEQRPS